MSAINSVQSAHDALLELQPEGASHHDCPLCLGAGTAENAKEVAEVADERTFTQTEHFALLTDAVARESASLTTQVQELESKVESLTAEKASEISELQTQLDVLAAEKATAEQAAADAAAEHEAFKTGLEEMAALEARKADRAAKVKEAASHLEEDYFTDDRIARWAAMSEEAFEALTADLSDVLDAKKKKKKDDAEDLKDGGADEDKEKSRETAAFAGGDAPTAIGTSLFGQFIATTGRTPVVTK